MSESTLVLDQPNQIEAFRLLATLRGLEMEVKFSTQYGTPPTALPTRGLALRSARAILRQYNVPGTAWGAQRNACVPRTRKQALKGMRQLCQQLGLVENT